MEKPPFTALLLVVEPPVQNESEYRVPWSVFVCRLFVVYCFVDSPIVCLLAPTCWAKRLPPATPKRVRSCGGKTRETWDDGNVSC